MVPPAPGTALRRHRLATRLWHWTNAVALIILLGSGLGISNAHPRLYWGRYGANFDHAWATLPHFPPWLTIPMNYNLAISRRWHLFFALVFAFGLLAFMIASLVNRHFARDLTLRREDVTPAPPGRRCASPPRLPLSRSRASHPLQTACRNGATSW